VAVEDWKPGSDSNFCRWHQENCAMNEVTNRNDVTNLHNSISSMFILLYCLVYEHTYSQFLV